MELSWRAIHAALREQGWTTTKTNGNHWRCTPPDKSKPIVVISESGEHRAIRNSITQLRASGLRWEDEPASRRKPAHEPAQELEDPIDEVDHPMHAAIGEPEPGEPEPDPDQAYALLKSAREDHVLARMHEEECELAVEKAQAALSEARQSRTGHANRLRQAKALFDMLFAAASDDEQAAQ